VTKVIFLELYKQNDSSIFWENQHFFALLDRYPVSPGHALVVPKREVLSIFDLNTHEKAGFLDVISEAKNAIPWKSLEEFYSSLEGAHSNKALQSDHLGEASNDFNIGVNEGSNAGRTVEQLHVHIIPRYPGDCRSPKGGLRLLMGPELGHY